MQYGTFFSNSVPYVFTSRRSLQSCFKKTDFSGACGKKQRFYTHVFIIK
ncbi:hypothetical protein CHCC15087_3830 [Bacillus licheniformis]|nr:hypothetical protein CHCC15087_3830 [Bacillus licheniformis]